MGPAIVIVSSLAVWAATAPASDGCRKWDRNKFCRARVATLPLRYEAGGARLRANVELGKVLTITFPDSVEIRGDPVVGNGLFRVEAEKSPSVKLSIWPELPQDAEEADMVGLRTNLQVFLDSDLAVLLELQVAKPGEGMHVIRVTFPEREQGESEYIRNKISELDRVREERLRDRMAGLDSEVQRKAEVQLARALLRNKHCRTLPRSRDQDDLLILWAEELCRIGDGLLFVRFYVKNRRRDLFTLGDVSVEEADGEAGSSLEQVQVVWEKDGKPAEPQDVHLAFGHRAEGMAVVPVAEELGAARSYRLTVTESGGRKRSVSVTLGF